MCARLLNHRFVTKSLDYTLVVGVCIVAAVRRLSPLQNAIYNMTHFVRLCVYIPGRPELSPHWRADLEDCSVLR